MVSTQEWHRRRYVWKCVASVMAGCCFVALELLDFPPLFWTLDAHALWHLSTVPIPLLWYRYVTIVVWVWDCCGLVMRPNYVAFCDSFLTDDAHYEMALKRKTV